MVLYRYNASSIMVGWVAPLGAVADGWWLVIIQGGRYWPVMERSSTVYPMLIYRFRLETMYDS